MTDVPRVFQTAGTARQVADVPVPAPDRYEWRNHDGEALVRIDWSGTGQSG
ncbi:hypothetical protein OG413_29870 [Streptomyces sp. NBC_01433]|uniref:hypothetical protein n=1 Tax=Streptomyces sp. NBC_01433 TaxID=2903864 RepID=UPI00224F5B42|nr:hypothetical protein [Streptomyces sp. NBC_01433]MCX4679446.1 hypothetical protein [Streptomyces sp. NBC_01433]